MKLFHPHFWASATCRLGRWQFYLGSRKSWRWEWGARIGDGAWYGLGPVGLTVWDKDCGCPKCRIGEWKPVIAAALDAKPVEYKTHFGAYTKVGVSHPISLAISMKNWDHRRVVGTAGRAASIVVGKSVDIDEGGVGECPFCKQRALRWGTNADRETFYHCDACPAGGKVWMVTMDGDHS